MCRCRSQQRWWCRPLFVCRPIPWFNLVRPRSAERAKSSSDSRSIVVNAAAILCRYTPSLVWFSFHQEPNFPVAIFTRTSWFPVSPSRTTETEPLSPAGRSQCGWLHPLLLMRNRQELAPQRFAIDCFDGPIGLISFRHIHKTVPLRLAGLWVTHHLGWYHGTIQCEELI